jgi:hypothetical protein
LDYLLEQERRGKTLVTFELTHKWRDEATDDLHWDEAVVRDWRTGKVLERFDHEELADLNFTKRGWFDVEHYDEWEV